MEERLCIEVGDYGHYQASVVNDGEEELTDPVSGDEAANQHELGYF